ncbi:MAG: glycosyltransferase [Kiritimatiellia bacterium]
MTTEFFNATVHEGYDPLYRFAVSTCRDPEDALDLTQNAFHKLAQKGHTLRIQILIPVFQDREALCACLHHLLTHWMPEEVLVIDSGEDGAGAEAEKMGVRTHFSPPERRGRAKQMNDGAARVPEADLLVFLHADTRLPRAAREALCTAFRQGGVGGGFSRRFDSPSRFLGFTCRLADLRGRTMGWFLGDQVQFVRGDVFRSLGGFSEIPLFEDLDFSRRLKKQGRVSLLTPPVISSARRFEADGAFTRTWKDLRLTLRYLRRGIQTDTTVAS